MVQHAFNLSTWEAGLCEFRAKLVYTDSSRSARATLGDHVSNRTKQKTTKIKSASSCFLVSETQKWGCACGILPEFHYIFSIIDSWTGDVFYGGERKGSASHAELEAPAILSPTLPFLGKNMKRL